MKIINRNNYIKNQIEYLKNKCLIINENDYYRLSLYLKNYGYETIINEFKYPFIYNRNEDTYIYNTNCYSIIELFNFDRQSANYILKNILNIERRLAFATSCVISEYIEQHYEYEEYDGLILKIDLKLFNHIFNKFRARDKKRVIRLTQLLIKDKEKINQPILQSINELKDKLDFKINEQFLNFFKHVYNLKENDTIFSNSKFKIIYDDEQNWIIYIKEYLNVISYKQIKNWMLSEIKKKFDLKINNQYLNENDIPIWILSKKWTLGVLINILESLNTKLKHQVIEYMFKFNDFSYHHDSFINEFIEVMKALKIVRNKICHNEPIYNLELDNLQIVSFLINNNYKFSKTWNHVPLSLIIECICLFEKYKNQNEYSLKNTLLQLFNKTFKTPLTEHSKNYLKNKLFCT